MVVRGTVRKLGSSAVVERVADWKFDTFSCFHSPPPTSHPVTNSIRHTSFCTCRPMALARRSALRSTIAAQSLYAAPAARRTTQLLGHRFYASNQGYQEGHKTGDLPWYVSFSSFQPHHCDETLLIMLFVFHNRLVGSVGVTVPVVYYLLQSGPEKKPHGDGHGDDRGVDHAEENEEDQGSEQAEEAKQPADETDKSGDKPSDIPEKPEKAKEKAEDTQATMGKNDEDKKDKTSVEKDAGAKEPKKDDHKVRNSLYSCYSYTNS